MQSSTTNATENGASYRDRIADFDVYKAWQFSKYNVRRDPIFDVETLMATHRIKEVGYVPFGRFPRP